MEARLLGAAFAATSAFMALPAPLAAVDGRGVVSIVTPAQGEVYSCFPVEISFDLDRAAVVESEPLPRFRLLLNRHDIEPRLEPTDTGFRALISPEDGLRVGVRGEHGLDRPGLTRHASKNTLVATVRQDRRWMESERRRFSVEIGSEGPPTAVAGDDALAFLGETAKLDGSGSSDPACTPALRYDWRLVEKPEGSTATLHDADTAYPTLAPDVAGAYVAELVVDNGTVASEADTVTVTARSLAALTLGPVDSPVHDAISDIAPSVPYDGSQNLSDFDVLMVDGDSHEPSALRDSELLNDAFHLGKHIVAVDLADSHRSGWLYWLTNFGAQGATEGIVVQQGKDIGGWPIIRMAEMATPDRLEVESVRAEDDPGLTSVLADMDGVELGESAEAFAATVLDAVRDPSLWDPDDPDNPIPPDLVHVRWVKAVKVPFTLDSSGKRPTPAAAQKGSHSTNYTFTLMLDNEASPQGDRQYLAVLANGEMSPNDQGSTFVRWDKQERAWFQDQMLLNIAPVSSDSTLWSWVASAPSTPNTVTTYTDSISFTVGFQGGDGTGNFNWTSGKTRTITDWGVKATGGSVAQAWDWRSTNNGNTDQALGVNDYRDRDAGWFSSSGHPINHNLLTQNQMAYHASIVWQTATVWKRKATFDVGTTQHLVDLWCRENFGALCTVWSGHPNKWQAHSVAPSKADQSTTINLAAVVPVPLKGITFGGQNPVVGGGTVKATVTLEQPAPMDIPVGLKSTNDLVATVPPRVTIPKGKTSATFDVSTLIQQAEIQVVIEALYGEGTQARLTVKPKST
ncbi:MAG: hypothetical protein AAF637_03860 [Pseudomonadota bacterium]